VILIRTAQNQNKALFRLHGAVGYNLSPPDPSSPYTGLKTG